MRVRSTLGGHRQPATTNQSASMQVCKHASQPALHSSPPPGSCSPACPPAGRAAPGGAGWPAQSRPPAARLHGRMRGHRNEGLVRGRQGFAREGWTVSQASAHGRNEERSGALLTPRGEEQVLRLDVAVRHAVRVVQHAQHVQQRRDHLRREGERGGREMRRQRREMRRQRWELLPSPDSRPPRLPSFPTARPPRRASPWRTPSAPRGAWRWSACTGRRPRPTP